MSTLKRPVETFQSTVATVCAIGGSTVAALGIVGTCLDFLENPIYRWLVWVIAIGLLFAARQVQQTIKTTIETADRNTYEVPNPHQTLYAMGGVVALIFLAADVGITLTRSPISTPGFTHFRGTIYGYTPSVDDSVLLTHNIKNINPTITKSAFDDRPFVGPFTETVLQRRKGNEYILFHEFVVEVVRFEEMPTFIARTAGADFTEVLELTFLLERRTTPLPWLFQSDVKRFVGKGMTKMNSSPFLLSDDTPIGLRYYVSAQDPGVYWCNCYVETGVNVGKPIREKLNADPFPLAFYSLDNPVVDDAAQVDAASGLKREIDWLTTGDMRYVPVDDDFDANAMADHLRTQLENLVAFPATAVEPEN